MSLATIMTYGDGFEEGQADMENRVFDLTSVAFTFAECMNNYELTLQEAFCNGYVDGGQAYLEDVKL